MPRRLGTPRSSSIASHYADRNSSRQNPCQERVTAKRPLLAQTLAVIVASCIARCDGVDFGVPGASGSLWRSDSAAALARRGIGRRQLALRRPPLDRAGFVASWRPPPWPTFAQTPATQAPPERAHRSAVSRPEDCDAAFDSLSVLNDKGLAIRIVKSCSGGEGDHPRITEERSATSDAGYS